MKNAIYIYLTLLLLMASCSGGSTDSQAVGGDSVAAITTKPDTLSDTVPAVKCDTVPAAAESTTPVVPDKRASLVWNNGVYGYTVTSAKGVLHFEGGNSGEGGYGFNLTPSGNGDYVLGKTTDYNPSGAPYGAKVSRKQLGGASYYVFYDKHNRACDVLREGGTIESTLKECFRNALAGYYDDGRGGSYLFTADGKVSIDGAKAVPYDFGYDPEFGVATTSIVLGKGKASQHYKFVMTKRGMNLFLQTKDSDDYYESDNYPAKQLTWKGGTTDGDKLPRFALARKQLLMVGFLSLFDKATLKEMEKEIKSGGNPTEIDRINLELIANRR